MNILLVDDHSIVLEGVKSLLQSSFNKVSFNQVPLGETSLQAIQVFAVRTVAEAMQVFRKRELDVVVSDLELGQDSGMAFLKNVRYDAPNVRIVIYTMHEEPWTVQEILDFDANAVVMKSDEARELVMAVEAVRDGNSYYSTSFCRMLRTLRSQPARLSDREYQVLDMAARGFSISDTAEELHVTTSTVEFHRRRIMQKLQAVNVSDMIRKATDLGWNVRI